MTEKVIEFPKHKVVREVPEDHIIERNRKAELKIADQIIDDMTGFLVTELDNYDMNVQDKDFAKDLVLVADAIKSAVYRQYGFDHYLQTFVDKNVRIIEDAEDMTKEELAARIESIMLEVDKEKEK